MIKTLFNPNIERVHIEVKETEDPLEHSLLNLLLHCIGHEISSNTFNISEIRPAVLKRALCAFSKTGIFADIVDENEDFSFKSIPLPCITWIPSVKKKLRFSIAV